MLGEHGQPRVHPLGVGQITPVREQAGCVAKRQPRLDLMNLQGERDYIWLESPRCFQDRRQAGDPVQRSSDRWPR